MRMMARQRWVRAPSGARSGPLALLGLAAGLAFGPSPAWAQDATPPAASDEPAGQAAAKSAAEPAAEEASAAGDSESTAADMAAGLFVARGGDGMTFGFNADLTTFIGQGVFASGKGRTGTVLSQLGLSPSLSVGPVLLFASQAIQLEYTDPDNPTGRRVAVFDTTLGVQYPLRFEAIDTRLALSGGLRLPVSWQSRAQGSIGGMFVGGTAAWSTPLDGLRVSLGLRGQLNSSIESLRATGSDNGPSLEQEAANCLTRAGEDASDACGAVPNVVNASGQLQVAYTRGSWTGSIGMSVLAFVRSYAGPDDDLRSPNARAGVNGTVFSSGTIQLSWVATDFLVVSGGLSSFQPIQTADGQGMRFPFWNFSGVANGFSSVFIGTTLLL